MVDLQTLILSKSPKGQTQRAGNDQVRKQLITMGDDGVEPRHVIHYFFARRWTLKRSPRQDIIDYVTELGFTVQDSTKNCVMFDTTSAIVGEEFDQLTDDLYAFGQTNGWTYDGWECAVVGVNVDDEAA